MAKCLKCGREIDVIARDSSKVFFCTKCSQELLKKRTVEKDEKNILKSKYRYLFIILPGIHQLKNGFKAKGCLYMFSGIILPLFWFLLFYFELKLDIITVKTKGINYLFTLFIIINFILIILNNAAEIIKEE